jgi:hypothetical protein
MKPAAQERRGRAAPAHPAEELRTQPAALAACLFGLSFSTVLFTLALFKLLSFFIMPSLFFDLLFIGFPVGAFLGARFFGRSGPSFRRSLWILFAAGCFSTAACLACKHFDYLRAHLFEVEIPKLLGQITAFTGLFIPYFSAYGLSEYVGYQFGRERLRGRMGLVYALYLFGAAAAYLFFRAALSPLGIAAMIAIALGVIALGIGLLGGGARPRWLPLAVAAAVLSAGLAPALLGKRNPVEQLFLDLYKGSSDQSSRALLEKEGSRSVFHDWGRYSFCEILWSPQERSYKGLYNDFFQWEYGPGAGFADRSLGAVPLWFPPRGGKVAIIGAGGGRQVQYSRRFGFERVLALEIEPAVIGAVRGPLAQGFDRVYEAPGVEVKVGEARSHMEATAERFDLIYLPSVGGYPQMMLEPGNLIRTHEAYRTLRDRLTPSGVLAIWYPAGLDPAKVLTDQYVRTLRQLDMEASAYQAVDRRDGVPLEFLILASRRDPGGARAVGFEKGLQNLEELKGSEDRTQGFLRLLSSFFVAPAGAGARTAGLSPLPEVEPQELPVLEDPLFTPITDDKPFLAGNVRLIFSMEQVYTLFAAVGGVLLAASAAVGLLLRRRGDPRIPGRSYLQVALLSALIGANFLLAEHYLVLAFFKRLFVFYDSLVLGAVAFLILSGLGSILIRPRFRGWLLALAGLSLGLLLAFHLELPARWGLQLTLGPTGVLLLFAPVAFVTGSFFPAVFDLAAANPLGVFAMDAVGAAFGSLAAFFLPIGFGFQAFFAFAAAVFLATLVAFALFVRRLRAAAAPPPAI